VENGCENMRAGVAYSSGDNGRYTIKNVLNEAIAQSGGADLVIVFSTEHYNLQEVLTHTLDVTEKVVGCCTAGLVTPEGVLNKGVGVCTLKGVKTQTYLGETCCWREGEQAGERLGEVKSGTALIFPNGSATGVPDFLRGIYNRLGPEFVYNGGCSGDNLKKVEPKQFTEKGFTSSGFAAATIDVTLSGAIGHGWSPITPPMVVTKASGKVVSEIEGEIAFEVYSKFAKCTPRDFAYYGMRHPLGLPCACGGFLIRDPITVKDDGSIEFVSEVPQNSVVAVMDCRYEDLIKIAGKVAETAVSSVKKAKFALVFDCVSRWLLLGSRFENEVQAIRGALEVPFIGMLTFGEIHASFGVPLLHNKTVVVAVGGEK